MCNFLVLFFLALEVLCECPAAQGRCGRVSTVWSLPCPLGAVQAASAHAPFPVGAVRTACLMLPEHSKDVLPH